MLRMMAQLSIACRRANRASGICVIVFGGRELECPGFDCRGCLLLHHFLSPFFPGRGCLHDRPEANAAGFQLDPPSALPTLLHSLVVVVDDDVVLVVVINLSHWHIEFLDLLWSVSVQPHKSGPKTRPGLCITLCFLIDCGASTNKCGNLDYCGDPANCPFSY